MASPRSIGARSLATPVRRYRRSSFNGAKQLKAAQAPNRRILVLLGLLALALIAALAVIVGVHIQKGNDGQLSEPAATTVTHPSSY